MLVPWELVLLFKFDQKFALKVKEFVETREEVVDRILIDYVLLHERTGVVLSVRKREISKSTDPQRHCERLSIRRLPA